MPAWGRDNPDSAKCLACAKDNNATIAPTCGPEFMVVKACGQAGGFPKADADKTLVV